MQLLRTGELTWRFGRHLEWATEVDIAVAWVTSFDAVTALIESAADTKVRIAVGLSGNYTDPAALKSLEDAEGVELRIVEPPRNGIFHWKYYCFRRDGEARCWVGSANLTRGGFHRNEEVVHEFDAGEAETRQWFEDLWRTLDRDPAEAIVKYCENYEPPERGPFARTSPADEPHLSEPEFARWQWADFVHGLRARDDYCHYARHGHPSPRRVFGGEAPWDIFGETQSYLHTIAVGRTVTRRRDWRHLSSRDSNILLGRDDDEGVWGLLGNMTGAGRVMRAFNHERNGERDVTEIRARIRAQLGHVFAARDDDVVERAQEAVRNIMEIHGFGHGAATRLLSLARPDRLVSVNDESKSRIRAYFGRTLDIDDPERFAREICGVPALVIRPCMVQSGASDGFRTGDLELPRRVAGRLFLHWTERLMSHDSEADRAEGVVDEGRSGALNSGAG